MYATYMQIVIKLYYIKLTYTFSKHLLISNNRYCYVMIVIFYIFIQPENNIFVNLTCLLKNSSYLEILRKPTAEIHNILKTHLTLISCNTFKVSNTKFILSNAPPHKKKIWKLILQVSFQINRSFSLEKYNQYISFYHYFSTPKLLLKQ